MTQIDVPLRLLCIMLASMLFAGCAAFAVPEEPPSPTPFGPVWSAKEVRDHLEFFNDPSTAGRATGTQGYAGIAAYVAARLREFRLQPALDDFRVVYGTSINYPVAAAMRSVGRPDSLILRSGIDFLPDGRSDSGRVSISNFVVVAGGEEIRYPSVPFGVIAAAASTTALAQWRDAGASLVILTGDLQPRLAQKPVTGLVVMQVTEEALARLLGDSEPATFSRIGDRSGETVSLDSQVFARVMTEYQPRSGAINILAYMAGKHPVHARELVIVCSDLDAPGIFAGVRVWDFRNFGVSTAAVLDVARNLAFVSRRWQQPERSVMIAIWSGSLLDHAGLRYFLENSTWSLDNIASVIYVGLRPQDEPTVRDLLSVHGIALHAIPPSSEPLFTRPIVLQPDPAVRRLPRESGEESNLSSIMDKAVNQALQLADTTYFRTMMESIR